MCASLCPCRTHDGLPGKGAAPRRMCAGSARPPIPAKSGACGTDAGPRGASVSRAELPRAPGGRFQEFGRRPLYDTDPNVFLRQIRGVVGVGLGCAGPQGRRGVPPGRSAAPIPLSWLAGGVPAAAGGTVGRGPSPAPHGWKYSLSPFPQPSSQGRLYSLYYNTLYVQQRTSPQHTPVLCIRTQSIF